jgi:hypothetical protein
MEVGEVRTGAHTHPLVIGTQRGEIGPPSRCLFILQRDHTRAFVFNAMCTPGCPSVMGIGGGVCWQGVWGVVWWVGCAWVDGCRACTSDYHGHTAV